MLSVIICSRSSTISQKLKNNIEETIGVEYEIIFIDNSMNNYSIFSAYNEGVKRAQYAYLCFMHEDILYHTPNWGEKVIEYLSAENVGIIGIGGSHYLSKIPLVSCWDLPNKDRFYSLNLLQGYTENKNYKTQLHYNVSSNIPIYGVTLDGVWFCIKKSLFEATDHRIKFDDVTYNGFHLYDFDICMQIHELNLQVQIVPDILIEHKSEGSFNQEWIKATLTFYGKWREKLPLFRGIQLSYQEIESIESTLMDLYIRRSHETQDQLQKELQSIRKSKNYRLGKLLLKPLRWIKSLQS
ncbi:glycosyltransferase [Paludibacter sp.]|uniref:glycosyltransferase n=1 Tax=Paludibacter sp. TaxID=1898105 RepID=UPI00135246D3|nr:glycosyltransferase [Paludibacter sp.]MTK52599.1 glycosyltransferase [Paludibacter sp.]